MDATERRPARVPHRKRPRTCSDVVNERDARRILATQLMGTLHADSEGGRTSEVALRRQRDRVVDAARELDALTQLGAWIDRFVDLQLRWVECTDRVDSAMAVRIWDRLDAIVRHAIAQPSAQLQLAALRADLPAVVERATQAVQTRPAVPELTRPPPVKLTHQWLPRVILQVYESVETEGAAGRCRSALVDAMRRLVATVGVVNPYQHLQVLYRPPPEEARSKTVLPLRSDPLVRAVARFLEGDMGRLLELANWMNRPDGDFWRMFERVMHLTRRVSVAFHHVMLFLYGIAMQRQDANDTVAGLAQQIHFALDDLNGLELRSTQYRLAHSLQHSSDPVVRETYRLFPEVLVYVDQWRFEPSIYEHGFAPSTQARTFEVGFNRAQQSKAWYITGRHLKSIARAWKNSGIGQANFVELSFDALGELERDIKYRLGEAINFFYQQSLAKWSQQRFQYSRNRQLMEIELIQQREESDPAPRTETKSRYVGKCHKEAAQGRGGIQTNAAKPMFRAPKTMSLVTHARSVPASARNRTQSSALEDEIDTMPSNIEESDILKWSDKDIDMHEQEKARVFEMQSDVLTLRSRMVLPQLLLPSTASENEAATCGRPDPADASASRALLYTCERLSVQTRHVVAAGQQIALHGAAEALIQRPSLRELTPEHELERNPTKRSKRAPGCTDEVCDDSVQELHRIISGATERATAIFTASHGGVGCDIQLLRSIAEEAKSLQLSVSVVELT